MRRLMLESEQRRGSGMDGAGDDAEGQFAESQEETALPGRKPGKLGREEISDSKGNYDIWKQIPDSIQERRQRFFHGIGLADAKESSYSSETKHSAYSDVAGSQSLVLENSNDNYRAVLRTPTGSDILPSSRSQKNDTMIDGTDESIPSNISCHSIKQTNDYTSPSIFDSRREPSLRIKNLDNGKEYIVEEGNCNMVREANADKEISIEEFEKSIGRSAIVSKHLQREITIDNTCDETDTLSKKKNRWLKHLMISSKSFSLPSSEGSDRSCRNSEKFDVSPETQMPRRIKVCYHKKTYKEFSAMFLGQQIKAHEGAIWTMKFSLDGRFLASAGHDRIIHIREVTESKSSFEASGLNGENFFPTGDASTPEDDLNKKNMGKHKARKKSSKCDFIVLPKKVFHLSEVPLCSFSGHQDDILDLSWSQSQYLLSASMDKTVRLWHVGNQTCLRTFHHKDIVTSIQFNPVDDGYFISGSLDKKVRIWNVPDCHVVDWTGLREMVTAVSYTPNGKGAAVGTSNGNCRFYSMSGNKIQLEKQVIVGKKRKNSSGKITGFQFVPGDSKKVLITSADSRIRIVEADKVICKYKGGFQNKCSQVSALFCPNGKHVVCASEDSRVYIWNYDTSCIPTKKHGKITCFSNEHFRSNDVSVAVPWSGITFMFSHRAAEDTLSCQTNNAKPLGFKGTVLENGFLLQTNKGHQSEGDLEHGNQTSDIHDSGPVLQHVNQTSNMDDTKLSKGLSGHHNIYTHSSLDQYQTLCQSLHLPGNSNSLNPNHAFLSTATWPEEKLPSPSLELPKFHTSYEILTANNRNPNHNRSKVAAAFAWGTVIVTADHSGEIRTFQNNGLPIRL